MRKPTRRPRRRPKSRRPTAAGRAGSSRRAALIQSCLDDINGYFDRLKPFEGRSWDALSREEQELIHLLTHDLNRLALRLARMGVHDDREAPQEVVAFVQRRIRVLRGLGSKELLRRARSGLEKGVARPMPKRDLDLWAEITSRREGGESLEVIRNDLIAKGQIRKMTRQAFHQLVARLDR